MTSSKGFLTKQCSKRHIHDIMGNEVRHTQGITGIQIRRHAKIAKCIRRFLAGIDANSNFHIQIQTLNKMQCNLSNIEEKTGQSQSQVRSSQSSITLGKSVLSAGFASFSLILGSTSSQACRLSMVAINRLPSR